MLDFSNPVYLDHESYIFIPENIRGEIEENLSDNGIEFIGLSWRDVPAEKQAERNRWIKRYLEAGDPNAAISGAIVSKLDPEWIFEKSLSLFGKTIDKDHEKKMQDRETFAKKHTAAILGEIEETQNERIGV